MCVVLRAPRIRRGRGPGRWSITSASLPRTSRRSSAGSRPSTACPTPAPTIIEANSIGLPTIQNLNLPANEVIGHTTTQSSKPEMLTTLEFLLQQQTLKIHSGFRQLLEGKQAELIGSPDASITQDSVIALAIAVANRHLAHDVASTGRNRSRAPAGAKPDLPAGELCPERHCRG